MISHTPPFLSVIVPVFNREITIFDCIDSVLKQTVQVNEIIIVDDGSTDRTGEVVRELASQYEIVKLVQKENGGVASARNLGLSLAKGDWILFLDSDDQWVIDKVKNVIELAATLPEVDFIHTNRSLTSVQGFEQGRDNLANECRSKPFLFTNWAIKTSTVALQRRLLDRAGSHFDTSLKTCEDYELFWRCIFLADKVGYIESSDTIVSLGADGISRATDFEKLVHDNIAAIQKFQQWLVTCGQKSSKAYSLMEEKKYWEYVNLFRRVKKTRSLVRLMASFFSAVSDLGLLKASRSFLYAMRHSH